MTKTKQQTQLIAQAAEYLTAIGATEFKESIFEGSYSLDTKHGALKIRLDRDHTVRGQEPTISLFCKFDNPKAIVLFDLPHGNSHTGKWNHHFVDAQGLPSLVERIEVFTK